MIHVLLVDDHKIMREGLAAILRDEEDIEIIAEASNGVEAIAQARRRKPDVIIMDLTLPDMGGVEATKLILGENPQVQVLVLTMFLDEFCVCESLEAGARGYLIKDCASEELVAAIRTIHQGKPYFCAEAQEIMMSKISPTSLTARPLSQLTRRELEVLKLTALGSNTKEIAFQLELSIKTVEVHRMKAKKKLGLHSIAQLTAYAIKAGLIPS
jgi:DNA-binding NarL/FixJ family response regulator